MTFDEELEAYSKRTVDPAAVARAVARACVVGRVLIEAWSVAARAAHVDHDPGDEDRSER
jgi:hypothetical protein